MYKRVEEQYIDIYFLLTIRISTISVQVIITYNFSIRNNTIANGYK